MLRSRHFSKLHPFLSTYCQKSWTRELYIFDLLKKAKEKHAQSLQDAKDEARLGYFDDFREFRENEGKLFEASTQLIPAEGATQFPSLTMMRPDRSKCIFPPPPTPTTPPQPTAILACVAVRQAAQAMLDKWSAAFGDEFHDTPGAQLYDLALIDSLVFANWPFRNVLLFSGLEETPGLKMQPTKLFFFKHRQVKAIRNSVGMLNKLTAYAYLLDSAGRIRWQGSGMPKEEELQLLKKATWDLLEEKDDEKDDEKDGAP